MAKLILNRYQPIVEAGSGGFASVIVAWDTRIQRSVAIKCIPLGDALSSLSKTPDRYDDALESFDPEFDEDSAVDWVSPFRKSESTQGKSSLFGSKSNPVAQESISLLSAGVQGAAQIPGLEEARTAAHLNDANIVQVYDFEVQGDTAYLILEYVEGLSLADLLKKYPNQIDADIVAAVFKAVSHALEVAHKNKVLHLDIKPDNVLIDGEGKVKVVDFGLARLAGESGFGSATGGTIGYMPPEQMNQIELDERCDQWALASLTYEMLSGANPFKVARLEDAEDAIYGAEIVIPSLCMEGIDESIDDIMFCALDPDRDNRYKSVKEFAKEMKPCLGNASKGKKKLAEIVSSEHIDTESFDEQPEENEEQEPVYYERPEGSILDRMSDRLKLVLMRVWALVSVAAIMALSLNNFWPIENTLSNPIALGVLAACLVVTAIFPAVGVFIALEFFGVMLILKGAILPALILMFAVACWWIFMGRFSVRQCCVVLAPVLFGAIGLMPLAALMAGYFSRIKDSVASGVCALIVAFMLASLGTCSLVSWDVFSNATIGEGVNLNSNMITMIVQPATWLFVIAWVLSCIVVSLLCARQNKGLGILGVIIGAALMVAVLVVSGLFLADFAGSNASFAISSSGGVNTFAIIPVILCALIACLFIAVLGIPDSEFEEE